MAVLGSKITVDVADVKTLGPLAGVSVAVDPDVYATPDLTGTPVSALTSDARGLVVCYAIPGSYSFTPAVGAAIPDQIVEDTESTGPVVITAGTVEVGTVTTGAAGSPATVVNVGTGKAAVLDFTIPRGNAGSNGTNGSNGTKGDTGDRGPTGPVATIANTPPTDSGDVDLPVISPLGGGSPMLRESFTGPDLTTLVNTVTKSGHVIKKFGNFNTSNFNPVRQDGAFIIDPAASGAGWAFILLPHTYPFTKVSIVAEFIDAISNQEALIAVSTPNPGPAGASIQFYWRPDGVRELVKLQGGTRVPPGAVAHLSSALSTGGAITSLSVTSGIKGGVPLGITQPLSSGDVIEVRESTATGGATPHSQTFTVSADTAAGATTIPITSATPTFAFSSSPAAAVLTAGSVPGYGTDSQVVTSGQLGVSRWQGQAEIDLATSTITCRWPGGQQSWTDPDFATLWGTEAAVQIVRGATGDVRVVGVATDGPIPWDSSQPTTTANVPYLDGDGATYFSAAAPQGTPNAVKALWAPDSWATGAIAVLGSQWKAHNLAIYLGTAATARKLECGVSTDGTNDFAKISTLAVPFADGQIGVIGSIYDETSGDITFWTSTDPNDFLNASNPGDGGSWTQLGTAVPSGTSGPLYNSNDELRVGNRNTTSTLPIQGYVYGVKFMDTVAGEDLATLDFNSAVYTPDAQQNTWTAHGGGITYQTPQSSVIGLPAKLTGYDASIATLNTEVATLTARTAPSLLLATTADISNVSTEQTLWTPAHQIPVANLAAGSFATLDVDGSCDCQATSGTFVVRFNINGNLIVARTVVVSQTGAATNLAFSLGVRIYVETTGSSGVVSIIGRSVVITAASGTVGSAVISGVAQSVNLTTGLNVTIGGIMATASTSNKMRLTRCNLVPVNC